MNTRWIDVARLRLRSLVRREQVDAELERELRAHLDALIEENMASGMSPDEARRAAVLAFGGITQLQEESRDTRGVAMVENLLRDLRYTLRGLLREPLLLLAATTSIAIGAAGNVAVFSLAREFLFATPDVTDPDRLVAIQTSHSSHATYERWRDLEASGAMGHIAGFSVERQVNWFRGDAAVSITPMIVTANFFDVVGPPMARGRGFTTNEAAAERDPHLAVVSHAFWQRDLGGDTAVIGRSLTINGAPYTVIGILAPKLRSVAGLALAPSVYLPLNRSLDSDVGNPAARMVELIGRLEPGQSISSARLALDAADKRLARAAGDSVHGGVQHFEPVGALGSTSDRKRRTITVFFTMVATVSMLVLLIGCGNVAGLLMARATAKRPEIAIRLALGGTRARLVQQLMAEAFWLSLIGMLAGLGLSAIAMRAINSMTLPIPLPLELSLSLDTPALLCALGLLIVTMVASALLPALGATRVSLSPALKREERARLGRRYTARRLLLAGQVTVSAVLLVTAFLFLRNLQQSHLTNPGFDVDPLVVAQVGFSQGYSNASAESQNALLGRLAERVRKQPGVMATAFSTSVPLTVYGGSSSGRSAQFDDRAQPEHVEYSHADVSAGYFATLGIRLLGGREFGAADRIGTPNTVIVNQEFARRYLDGNALGRRFHFADDKQRIDYEIVGVVANGKYRTIGEEQRPAIYRPLSQQATHRDVAFVIARVRSDPATFTTSLRAAIGAEEPSVSVEVQPMRSAVAFALLPSRIGAAVLGGLGLMGLLLAAFGLYAIVSYNVGRRTSEIAIRTALGATRTNIIGLVIKDESMLVAIGVAAGLGIAAGATRLLSAFLVAGLSATDVVSFAGTAAVFVLVTVLASWFPARYATRVSPAIAMRLE